MRLFANTAQEQLENRVAVLEREVEGLQEVGRSLALQFDTVARTLDQLKDLPRDFADLEKPIRELEMEWQDWFEKFRNLYSRLSRREERADKQPDEPQADPINPLAAQLLGRDSNVLRNG